MDKDIALTPTDKIVAMTAGFPTQEVQGPVVYEQVIEAPGKLVETGKPDPAHDN